MSRRLRAIAAALVLLGAGAPAACAAEATPAPESEQLVLGAHVYRERCSPCHGDHGRGDGLLADVLPIRPRDYFSEPFRWGNEAAEIAETIRLGRSGVMPPFADALSDREIEAVAALVHLWATHAAAAPDPGTSTR